MVRSSLHTAAALASLPSLIAGLGFDCKAIVQDKVKWNLGELGGPHSVHYIRELSPGISNWTFTLDICRPLRRTKGVPASDECPGMTRVCGIQRISNPVDNTSTIAHVVPIAGDYTLKTGTPLEITPTRLRTSGSHADAEREGVRLEMKGGKDPLNKGGVKQKAIIEFICDRDRTGLEGDEPDNRDKIDDDGESLTRRDEPKKGAEKPLTKSLSFISYKTETIRDDEWGVLRLDWRTKYACEDSNGQPSSSSGGWGFFTWFIIILFMVVAAYLIFGSWLNYNRYGARGLDMVPHGDAIRDIPFLMKDWGRRVVSTVQSGGSRGGYSAV